MVENGSPLRAATDHTRSVSTMLRDGGAIEAYAHGVTLPSDILTRSADEAVRRIATHLLDEVRGAAARILGDTHLVVHAPDDLRAALRALDLHLRVLGKRFGVQAEDGVLLALGQDDPGRDHPSLAREAMAFADRAALPLRTISIDLDAQTSMPTYGVALAGVLRLATAELIAALEDFESGDGDGAQAAREVHEAALSTRDLLVPTPTSAAIDGALRACADAATRAEVGADALGELATASGRDELRARLDDAARSLEASTENEIEHKYLLRSFPPGAANGDPKDLAQGYVPGERLHERLRRVRHNGHVKYIRTVKMGSGLARMEIEEETTEDVFQAMWPLTAGCRVHKERYSVRDGALTWTIDRFVDRDLVLAEVEVPSTEIAPSPPSWLADYIVKDVTGDPAYVNLNLAR
jgi:CYTH domain-containing protein